jgi:hypothetical protein
MYFSSTQYMTPSYAEEYAYFQSGLATDASPGYRLICNAGGIVRSIARNLKIWNTGPNVDNNDDRPADIRIVLPA